MRVFATNFAALRADSISAAVDGQAHGRDADSMAAYKRRRSGKWSGDTSRCSFCGKPKAEVETVVAGPGVSICNECVEICVEIVDGKRTPSQ